MLCGLFILLVPACAYVALNVLRGLFILLVPACAYVAFNVLRALIVLLSPALVLALDYCTQSSWK
jgi:hypothetical protein